MELEIPDSIPEAIRDRLMKVLEAVAKTLPEEPNQVFVSTSLGQGTTDFGSAWLFLSDRIVEIRNPLSHDRIQYELARFDHRVDWIRLNARDYCFADPSEKSQLELEFTTTDGFSALLSANGMRCRELMQLYQCRFLPNFAADAVEQRSASGSN